MRLFGPNVNKMLQNGEMQGLIATMADKDAEYRIAAAWALGSLGKAEALEPLIRIFTREREIKVREAIANTFGQLLKGNAIKTLVHLLGDKDPLVRQISGKLLLQVDTVKSAIILRQLLDTRDLDILIEAMGDLDADVRKCSVNILSVLGLGVVPQLIVALSSSGYKQKNAAIVLGKIKGPFAVDGLLVLISDQNAGMEARTALKEIGSQVVLPKLSFRFAELPDNEKSFAINLIKDLEAREGIPLIIQALTIGDPNTRRLACSTLGEMAAGNAVNDLNRILIEDDESLVRGAAATALGKIGDQGAEPQLLKAFEEDQAENVRMCAAIALGEIGGNEAAEALLQELGKKTGKGIKSAAIKALGKLNWAGSVQALIEIMGGPDASLSKDAEISLVALNERPIAMAIRETLDGNPDNLIKLNDNRAITILFLNLGNKNQKTREAVFKALSHFGEQKFAEAFQQALAGQPMPLAELSDKRAIPPLLEILLKGEVFEFQQAAGIALSVMGTVAYDKLLENLNNSSINVQRAVIMGIGHSQDPKSADLLLQFLEDGNQVHTIKEAVVTALGESKTPHAVQPLIHILSLPEKRLRVTAAQSLGIIADPRALEPLLKACEDEDNQLRKAALLAIKNISVDAFWNNLEKEDHVRLSVLKELKPGELISFFIRVENPVIGFEVLKVLSEIDKGAQKILVASGANAKARDVLLSQLEDRKWSYDVAQCLLRLFPQDVSFDSQIIEWANQAMGYDHVGYSYSAHTAGTLTTQTSDRAIEAISAVKNSATNNLLHIICNKKDISIRVDKGCAFDSIVTLSISFTKQRQQAESELASRGNPNFNVAHYLAGGLEEKNASEIEAARTVIKEYVYQDMLTKKDYRGLAAMFPTPEAMKQCAIDLANHRYITPGDLNSFESVLIAMGKAIGQNQARQIIQPIQAPWPHSYERILKRILGE